jgi:hypothetical protein
VAEVTEQVQLGLINLAVMIVGFAVMVWRANNAAKEATNANISAVAAAAHAKNADDNAVKANNVAVLARAENARAIEQVHDAVNGGMAAGKKEIASLKDEIERLNSVLAKVQSPATGQERIDERRDH